MQNLWFEDCEDLACNIVTILGEVRKNDIYNDVAIVAKYEEARQIIRELVSFGYDLRSIHLEDNCYGGYDAEYIISICNIDGEDEIWCEPMLREDGYLLDESTVIYILDNCSSKVIPCCNGAVVYEVGIGDECDCDECCGCCECKEETRPTTSYSVNGKEVTKAEFNKKYEEFENKYMDNIRDMLLSYCEFMDEMNEWSKMFRW